MIDFTTNKRCRVCKNDELHKFLELGTQPPANAFLDEGEFENEKFFPLNVYFCPKCGLVQLLDAVSPDLLFRNYAYFTGHSSETLKAHLAKLANTLTKDFHLGKDDLVIDVGSNDGTLLKNFKTRVLGVDPTENVVKQAIQDGVDTVCNYFGVKTAFDILNEYGEAKVITGTNVFAHVNNLYDFMAGARLLLEEDGFLVIEVHHFLGLYKQKEFDTIYHEHLSYFLVRPILFLARQFGMELFRVEKIPIHGGSIRCYIGKRHLKWSVKAVLQEEHLNFLYDVATYSSFGCSVKATKGSLVNLLMKLKVQGKHIIGYGAPAKGNTLLNYCKIGPETLDYITDTTPYKQGKFSPGMHIPVVPPNVFHEEPPDYALMLPWNYEEEILKKEQDFIKNGGKFIIPIPEPRIIP